MIEIDPNIIWAKSNPRHSLLHHMIDVGNIALSLLSTPCFKIINKKFSSATGLDETSSMAWMAYLAAIHDIGKCEPDFQIKNEKLAQELMTSGILFPPEYDRRFLHEKRSHDWIKEQLSKEGWSRRSYNTVSNSILNHHSRSNFKDPIDYPTLKKYWDNYKEILNNEVKSIFKPPEISSVEFIDNGKAGLLLSGLIVLSDWIASNVDLMRYTDLQCSTEEYANISRVNAKKAISYLGFDDGISWEDKVEFCEVWPGSTFTKLRPIQQECVDIIKSCSIPRMIIIEAPMGEGKTEAAIYTAVQIMRKNNLSGMYVALPTAATSNQMYGRVNEFLELHNKDAIIKPHLVHGMSWVIDEVSPINVQYDDEFDNTIEIMNWFKPSKRALLAPYSVGTIDQSLMSVLNVKFGFLRLFGLSNKVLIIDEVHAYDAYMSTILWLLLKWCSCLEIPVILLSATLPSDKKQELLSSFINQGQKNLGTFQPTMGYPLVTYVDQNNNIIEEAVAGSSKHMNISLEKHPGFIGEYHKIASLALESSTNGGCICIILNTVKAAQKVYEALKNLKDDSVELLLFHSRFTADIRGVIEKKALKLFDKRSLLIESHPDYTVRPKRAILVATQVVEQSLDLDFDEMIVEIAPIDLILQRAGRLHRHDRKNRPTGTIPRLHILLPAQGKPDFGASEVIYHRYTLLRTLDIIGSLDNILIPTDIRTLVEKAYSIYTPDMMPSSSGITIQDLSDSYDDMRHSIDGEKGKASPYLITDPNKKEFSLALMSSAFSFDEDDTGTRSYFYAKTRLGDNTNRLLILNDDEFEDFINCKNAPSKDMMKRLMLKMASIPCSWINEYDAEPGYKQIIQGPMWLKGLSILCMNSVMWKGVNKNGDRVVITNDDEYGLRMEKL
ncbi:hypothetical protein CUJ83_07250 [Methanocella sp. CWC-04]|uniref:CRISPR-associated helicase, Cas3 family n=1 Tax=Methanooceanicella nereidis TaxID=2052831 RepID=A0AAP2W718_9EURY|nr:CRISPR-associated helicase Cas3' [Methanocella sp. CWC-04]MCD1294794.1 hypothetical protein [Methanocella sp. CWC-04]